MGGCLLREIRSLASGYSYSGSRWSALLSGIPHVRIAYSYSAHLMSHVAHRIFGRVA